MPPHAYLTVALPGGGTTKGVGNHCFFMRDLLYQPKIGPDVAPLPYRRRRCRTRRPMTRSVRAGKPLSRCGSLPPPRRDGPHCAALVGKAAEVTAAVGISCEDTADWPDKADAVSTVEDGKIAGRHAAASCGTKIALSPG